MTPERTQSVYRAIETHLRVARQIDRFAQFEVRAARPPQHGPQARIHIDVVEVDGPASDQSEEIDV